MALPNGPLEIVFSFDTTGSMSSYLHEVRGRVSDMVQRLQADIPGIRFSIFAHGDYCDKHNYVTKFIDFTNDVKELCDFVNNTGSTGGGDADECYELVLHEVRTKLSWQPGSQRALVMIGDCNPHEPNYPQNTLKLDWRKEVQSLGDIGVRIYGVRCGSYANSEKFYKTMSEQTGGHYLQLSDFKQIFDFLMTVCYNEKGADMVQMYEKEVRARHEPVHKDLNKLFGDLRDKDGPSAPAATSPAVGKPKLTKPPSITSLKPAAMGVVKKYKKTRVMAKRMKTVKDSLTKYGQGSLPRHRREEVSEKYFMLAEMAWSPWERIISSEPKGDCCHKRNGGKVGYRAKQIFDGHTQKPALYEIAVQPKFRCRRFVVYSKCSRIGFQSGLNWERKLFGKKDISGQIESVVKQGCDIYVRRAMLRSVKQRDNARQTLKRYDYAWSVIKSDRKSHRPVTKAEVDISEEMEI